MPAKRSMSLTEAYTELRRAEEHKQAAEKTLYRKKCVVERKEMAIREALVLYDECPCIAAILPDGMIAVHVWVEAASEKNQLHIVCPAYYNDDGTPRPKAPNEHLGIEEGDTDG